MDSKIWMVSLIIMFAVRPIWAQDAIFKMSRVSPVSVWPKNLHGSSNICPKGFIYSIQNCEISHQTFGPSHQKCPTCPMIFVNTAIYNCYLHECSVWLLSLFYAFTAHVPYLVSQYYPLPEPMLTQMVKYTHKAMITHQAEYQQLWTINNYDITAVYGPLGTVTI